MKLTITALCLLLPLFVLAATTPRDYVRDAFADAEFRPHVFTDAQLVQRYGVGFVTERDSSTFRVYYSEPTSRWVIVSGNSDVASRFREVEEITVVHFKPNFPREKFSGCVDGLSLLGVKIGDPRSKAIFAAQAGKKFRMKKKSLVGQPPLEELSFFPHAEYSGVQYRYWVDEHRVVGLSVGIAR